MQFHIIICGLDSVEARRWISATLVNMVDPDDPETLKPLIDGGTEGQQKNSIYLTNHDALLPYRLSRTGACNPPNSHFML